tara:strand:- start:4628 stop:6145 length:1518 start_codon:yes stop_codon:yes gene_type:complete
MSNSLEKQFFEIFMGLERAHGTYKLSGRTTEKGKQQGNALTKTEPVTEELWAKHLKGDYGLGIFPLNDNGKCKWGAIDIDIYNLDFSKLEKDLLKIKLPLTIFRTKSGGAHIYLFCKDFIDAKLLRTKLMEVAVSLGYSGVEIFPKQIRLASDKDFGNWLNMPYFNMDSPTRYAIKNNKKLSAEEFINLIKSNFITEEDLKEVILEKEPLLENGPPCLQSLSKMGFPDGTRNQGLFNLGVYVRKRYGEDELAEHLDEMNNQFMHPPLGHKEVAGIVKAVTKKNYQYRCNDQPICDYCNRQICLSRKFGIGGDSEDIGVEIVGIIKVKTEPPTWIVDINGARIEMSTETLLSQRKFQMVVLEELTIMTNLIKPLKWTNLMKEKCENAEEQDAPVDAGVKGQLLHYLEDFCTGYAVAQTRDEMLLGKPWTSEGRTYFRSSDFQKFLQQQRFTGFDGRKLWNALRSLDAKHHQFYEKGKNIQCWSIPEFSKQNQEFNVPKAEDHLDNF